MSEIELIMSIYTLLLFAGAFLMGFLLQYILHKVPFVKIGLFLYLVAGIYLLMRSWSAEFTLLSVTAGAFCLSAFFAKLARRATQQIEQQMEEDLPPPK
ncbi:hypothetical protein [Ectobacillus ponti]|uniref:Uncharacterized protein n=1 Tax=Ectobacillus ponti TaxID=2961894 RepID=A0AA41X491_9BACI|nr:hypothetical protein [Ectobacillus ponti]MCP8968452.1 hypothetical protein [Ectobacillus ponti]